MVAAVLRYSSIVAVDMANSTTPTPLTTTSVSTGVNNNADTNTGATAPELSDLDYFINVLHLTNGRTENQIEDDLVSKANALGISSAPVADKRITSSVESASTVYNARTFSMLSGGSTSTALTTHSSLFGPPTPDPALSHGRQSKDLNFTQYDRYLAVIDPHHNHPKTTREPLPPNNATPSIFSGKTKRSLFSVRSTFKLRWKKKPPQPFQVILTCVSCRADFKGSKSLHSLSCGHTYCDNCLRSVIHASMSDESSMPPRCCAQPLPGSIIRDLLSRDVQQEFLKAIVQYSTPWQARMFCSNPSCSEFIPPHQKLDPKYPSNVTCRKCNTRVCLVCKRNAHPTGKDCPEDWELDQVIKTGGKAGWRRCYKCHNLVPLEEGSTRMTCRCKAQFCYTCCGVWDAHTGCPNDCDRDEEMGRRKREEHIQLAEYEEEKAVQEAAAAAASIERLEAEERTRNKVDFSNLAEMQQEEQRRFLEFAEHGKEHMRIRFAEQRKAMIKQHAEDEEVMKEKHAKTISQLEDRQVAAEMDLRNTLEASARSVNIRLKHMEAYCDGLGRNSGSSSPDSNSPHQRVVTERDLRELGQQYNIRDGMERSHQAKINVMRDRQAKRMEELIDRQETEYENFLNRNREELDELTAQAVQEGNALAATFSARKVKLVRRWELAIEILRKELEDQDGVKYAPIPTPTWLEATVQALSSLK
ncbi:related to ariadne-2 protein [Fusarium torulosum]|uniref:RBR-type E3 ubiquitin transferase n=1 Tax=Fusarium torulosum TaxID=33205 RepID=A0AAE8SPJ1_9HYPO|nr:related to ariadne-2 protein [Fusarium torulosum]